MNGGFNKIIVPLIMTKVYLQNQNVPTESANRTATALAVSSVNAPVGYIGSILVAREKANDEQEKQTLRDGITALQISNTALQILAIKPDEVVDKLYKLLKNETEDAAASNMECITKIISAVVFTMDQRKALMDSIMRVDPQREDKIYKQLYEAFKPA